PFRRRRQGAISKAGRAGRSVAHGGRDRAAPFEQREDSRDGDGQRRPGGRSGYVECDGGEARVVIHPTAIISSDAVLGEEVEVGPYAIVGASVTVAKGTTIGPHTRIEGPTTIGERNVFYGHASIGS